MRTLARDLAHAVRLGLRRPGLTLVTVLTLGIAVGGNTAVFSVLNGLLLRPLPAAAPERLVRIFGTRDGGQFDVVSYPNFRDLAERASTLQSVAIHQQTFAASGLGDSTASAAVELVSGTYFTTFGVRPALGRPLAITDDREGAAAHVAVVSDAWWRTNRGASPAALGDVVHLNGVPFTIVGVMPPAFRGSYDALGTDLWVPLMAYDVVRPRGLPITRRGWAWLGATARLADGVTLEEARADVRRAAGSIARDFGEQGFSVRLEPATALPESMQPTLRAVLLFALAVVGLALGAACANIANVQLAGVLARQREIAVRLAMGASRGRIARQWLTESALLAGIASAAGLLLAVWLRDAALAYTPPGGVANFGPRLPLDWRLLAFSTATAAGAALLFGGLPAWRAARVDAAGPLRAEGRTATGTRGRGRAQAALIATQVAVSLALLVAAGLLTRSLRAQSAFDLGFRTDHLAVAAADLGGIGLDDAALRRYYRDTLARLSALPGVERAAAAVIVPLDGNSESRGVHIDGYVPPDGRDYTSVAANLVSPGYFETLGIPLRQGRGLQAADADDTAAPVVVINEAMARRFWTGDPIGRQVGFGADQPRATVVGVVGDTTLDAIGAPPPPIVYGVLGPDVSAHLSFVVRSAVDDGSLARALRRELRAVDPRVRVPAAGPYEELRAGPLFPQRVLVAVSTAFGGLALALTLVGLYGIITYAVQERRRELAVRLALGASPAELVRRVVGTGLRPALAGIVLGLGGAVLLTRLLARFLFGVSALDPMTFTALAALVVLVSGVAAYVPARRAAHIDPASALGDHAS
ncbi:MAG: ABC transporter permease [Vicinamibacterales bacterium]